MGGKQEQTSKEAKKKKSDTNIYMYRMAEIPPPEYDLNAKWDACVDLTLRRFAYSSLAGTFAGLLLFRSPVTRWASIAFGAGIGIGSAYTECSHKFGGSIPVWTSPKVAQTPQGEQE